MSKQVQAIVLPPKTRIQHISSLTLIKLVAEASLSAFEEFLSEHQQWLAQAMTKSVRQAATYTKFEKILEIQDIPKKILFYRDEPTAVAFAPMPYEQFPKLIAKTSLLHLFAPRIQDWEPIAACVGPSTAASRLTYPAVYVNADLGMSGGKVAAQVSHALIEASARGFDLADWRLCGVDGTQFVALDRMFDGESAGLVIVDNGLTEVLSGTTTVKFIA